MKSDKVSLLDDDFSSLRSAFDEVGDYLPYLKADITPTPEENFIACSSLLQDPKTLRDVIMTSGMKIGAPNEQVAASLFLLSYAYRILAMGISPLFISGVMPSSTPENVYFDATSGRVSKLCYLSAKCYKTTSREKDLLAIADDIVEGHLRFLTLRLRSEFSIGSRLLWGNIASAAASVFRTLEGLLGQDFIALGELFFTFTPNEMQNQGNFYLLSVGDKHGWYWERKNCCLYYQLGKDKCNDCSLIPQSERRQKYKDMLENG